MITRLKITTGTMSQTQPRRAAEPIRRRVDDELLTAQELAEYLKIPLATIYKQRQEGTGVPGHELGSISGSGAVTSRCGWSRSRTRSSLRDGRDTQEVLDLCDGLDGFPVLLITENCCDVDWCGLELRFKKNIDGTWDSDLDRLTRWSNHSGGSLIKAIVAPDMRQIGCQITLATAY